MRIKSTPLHTRHNNLKLLSRSEKSHMSIGWNCEPDACDSDLPKSGSVPANATLHPSPRKRLTSFPVMSGSPHKTSTLFPAEYECLLPRSFPRFISSMRRSRKLSAIQFKPATVHTKKRWCVITAHLGRRLKGSVSVIDLSQLPSTSPSSSYHLNHSLRAKRPKVDD